MMARSWICSAMSIGFMVALLQSLITWHGTQKRAPPKASFSSLAPKPSSQSSPTLLSRLLNYDEEGDSFSSSSSVIDDDVTRDEECRQYVMQFLNGTTDSRDECQGMYNAWASADCKDMSDYKLIASASMPLKKKHYSKNGTILSDDDVVMDDEYENWECCDSITVFYNQHCQPPVLDSRRLLWIVVVLLVCGSLKSLIRYSNVQWIPDAGAYIIVGAAVGGILRFWKGSTLVQERLTFDNDLFLSILLPPIIFEAAISINKQAFRRDLFPIFMFAIIGTGFSAVAIGLVTYNLTSDDSGGGLPLLDSLLYGALISSVDPAATLGILSSMGVNQGDMLYTLVFGESLMNDGVSIVLFDSLVHHMGDGDVVSQATIHDTVQDFLLVTTGSTIVGLFCGAACTVYFWMLQGLQNSVTEVFLFLAWALVPYYLADGLEYSGIISIMVMGFMMDYYCIGGSTVTTAAEDQEWMEYIEMHDRQQQHVHHRTASMRSRLSTFHVAMGKAFTGRGHMNEHSKYHVGFVLEVISSSSETAIFAYLGLFLFNDRDFNIKYIITGLFSCVSSRAVMVVVFSALINCCVYLNVGEHINQCWKAVSQRISVQVRNITLSSSSSFHDASASLLTQNFQPDEQRSPYDMMNDDASDMIENPHLIPGSNQRNYIDKKTQLVLFSAGVRGAVSYALVQNIPVYNAVTHYGSKYKGELRAMTSTTIVVLLFTFGALTYFWVKQDGPNASSNASRDHRPREYRVLQTNSHGLSSVPPTSIENQRNGGNELPGHLVSRLASDEIENSEYDLNLSMEIEGRQTTSTAPVFRGS